MPSPIRAMRYFFPASRSKSALSVARDSALFRTKERFTEDLGFGELKLRFFFCLFKLSGIGRLRECVTFKNASSNFKKVHGKRC